MVDLFILLILFIGVYSGYKRGVILQLLQTIGYVIAMLFALNYYKLVSEYLYLLIPYPTPFAPESNPYLFYEDSYMFSMDMSYYDLISFLAILFVGWLIVRFFIKLISYTLEKLRAPEPISGIGGGILGFGVNYIGVFLLLILLTTIPYGFIQNPLVDSPLANFMITSTPVVSETTHQLFIVDVNEEVNKDLPTMDIQPSDEESQE